MSRFVAAALAAAGLALAAGSAALAQTQAPIDEAARALPSVFLKALRQGLNGLL